MNQAKDAVKDFMSKSGHHDTTVHESVAPAVTRETVNTVRHEDIQTAIDKEIHQDHYHTSVQPIFDEQRLKEQHHHNLGAVEHRQFEHGNDAEVQQRLAAEAARFKDERIKGEVRETSSVAPTIAGEHIHHHVHETIQPVVNRQIIEPHVVHTTIPIHEVHHNEAQHHSTSALPAVSLADFKKQGGVLTGREERYDGFEGEPRSMTGHSTTGTTGTSGTSGLGQNATGRDGLDSTTGSSGLGSSSTGRDGLGSSTTGRDGLSSSTSGTSGHHHGSTGHSSTSRSNDPEDVKTNPKTGKPSLLDRLNPMKDSDHDGKKGFND